MTLHITLLHDAHPLPDKETLACLRSLIDQLSLFPSDRSLDRLHSVVFNDLRAAIAPSHQDPPLSDITITKAKRAVAALWVFISRSNVLYELRYAIFEMGKMTAWGFLVQRGEDKSAPILALTAEE